MAPDSIQVNTEIAMQAIARSADEPPGNGGFVGSQGRAETFDGFANDLDLSDDGGLCLLVGEKAISALRGEFADVRRGNQDMA